MPRGKAKQKGSVDEFVKSTVKYLSAKSQDSQEIILGMVAKELKAAGAGAEEQAAAAPKRKGLSPAARAKIKAGIKKAKMKKAREAAKAEKAAGGEGQEKVTAAPKKKPRKFTKVREGKKKEKAEGAGAGAGAAPPRDEIAGGENSDGEYEGSGETEAATE